MTYNDFMTQTETKIVTKRYKVTEMQDENFRYGGIKELWDRNKY